MQVAVAGRDNSALAIQAPAQEAGSGTAAAIPKNGTELWSATLSNNANANPMSYAGKSGKQRVAVISGDTVNVFGLP